MSADTDTSVQPAVFIGHGSPMNTLELNRWTLAWRELGATLPRPRAVLVVSAHWFIGHSAITAMERPRTIHDFYGFPSELFAFEYPAPGAPAVAEEVAAALAPSWVGLDRDSWGIDHGAWSVLAHLLPDADVPILQLSVDATKTWDQHLVLGRRLAGLRHEGVLVVASGNVVHNFRFADWSKVDAAHGWAESFDDAVRAAMTTDPAVVGGLAAHDAYHLAVPTPDHYMPLAYVAGVAVEEGLAARVVTDGHAYGSFSMAAYSVG